jgi:hypothetical protein
MFTIILFPHPFCSHFPARKHISQYFVWFSVAGPATAAAADAILQLECWLSLMCETLKLDSYTSNGESERQRMMMMVDFASCSPQRPQHPQHLIDSGSSIIIILCLQTFPCIFNIKTE